MKQQSGFTLRELGDTKILVAEGIEQINFNNIISLNETAAYLWTAFEGSTEFTEEDMVNALLQEYEVDAATAAADVKALVDEWQKAGLLA